MDTMTKEIQKQHPWTLLFADDVMLASESRDDLQKQVQSWTDRLQQYGLRLNTSKTEYMECGPRIEDGSIRVDGTELNKPIIQLCFSLLSVVQGSISKETAIATHAALSDLSPEKEKRLRELYERLDINSDGTVDIRDLTAALKHEMPHIPTRLAPKLMARINSGGDDSINFGDFVRYVVEHEKRLENIFQDLDKNNDGLIDVREIKLFCNELGIPLDDRKARDILHRQILVLSLMFVNLVLKGVKKNDVDDIRRLHLRIWLFRMDRSGSSSVDLSDFQQFMLLYPSSDVKDMVDFWRHNLVIDIGEDSQVPEDFTNQEMISGVWWRHLVAGAVAGCMSRTCTAPLDRLKLFMQVHSTRRNRVGVISSLRLLYAEGGTKSFWRGNGINVVKIAPESAIKFMAYDQVGAFPRLKLLIWVTGRAGSELLSVRFGMKAYLNN
ncbi:EF hand [Necator americanus]|uniref:EF hand n=1 Tax=Necator americanus TaxID=51031 RepID=W2SK00_NECAM|nr:EF hand [Necator americanus]ETN69196.1 EF hand [Necator americanus]